MNQTVVELLASSSPKAQTTLAEAHELLSSDEFVRAFVAARAALPPERVFVLFSPYIAAKGGPKEANAPRRKLVCHLLGGDGTPWGYPEHVEGPIDPRWLDLALTLENRGMVYHLARPGHAALNAFLSARFEEVLKKSKELDDCRQIVSALIVAAHPDATNAFVRSMEKNAKKNHYDFRFSHLAHGLPRSAVPQLEALAAKLPEGPADTIVGALEELRNKK